MDDEFILVVRLCLEIPLVYIYSLHAHVKGTIIYPELI
jgi:hypothetical protein